MCRMNVVMKLYFKLFIFMFVDELKINVRFGLTGVMMNIYMVNPWNISAIIITGRPSCDRLLNISETANH